MQELGNRAGEALTLNNMALVYSAAGKLQEALKLYEQALPLMQEVGDRAGEALTLGNLALLLYQHLNRSADGIMHLEQAIALLQSTGLPQDTAGNTVEMLQQILAAMRRGDPLESSGDSSMLPAALIQQIVSNTIAVMTVAQEHHTEWYKRMTEASQIAQQQGAAWQIEVDFYTAVLDILNGRSPTLSPDHSYAQAITVVQQGIAIGGRESDSDDQAMLAVQEFVNAENWEAKRHIVEIQQELLFQPEVETLFETNIADAKAAGKERIAQRLALHLAVLRACKQSGIAETFERIRQVELANHSQPDE
jgi:tetratricopeptide (TPR) repeat protein